MTLAPVSPDFIFQTAGADTDSLRRQWAAHCVEEAQQNGAVWARLTIHDTIKGLCLFEAWKSEPECEGEPRWGA